MTSNRFVADDVQSDDIFFVDPLEIELGEDAHDLPADEVLDMAISMHRDGQRRAVECHGTDGNRLVLDHGRIRTVAARMICTGFEHRDPETDAKVTIKNKRFKLKVVIVASEAR